MKKNGFTLVETIVTIFILIVLFTVTISLGKMGRNLRKNIEDNGYIYEIDNLLIYGKAVCKQKSKYGKVSVNGTNQIRFVEGWDNIERIVNLPKELKIVSKDLNLFIDPNGRITQGTTITVINDNGEREDITIGVGVDQIVIKNK